MRHLLGRFRLNAIICGAWWCLIMTAGAGEPRIELVEPRSNVFADSESKWNLRIQAGEGWKGSVRWRLSHAQRSLASGEREVTARDDQPGMLAISWKSPPVKDNVALRVDLAVSAGATELLQPVWIMPRNPVADRSEWLQRLKLKVFDPEGTTIARLEQLEFPLHRVRSAAGIDDVDEGVLIVGEDLPTETYPALMERLFSAAQRGVSVLCLARSEGHFDWPEEAGVVSVQFRRRDVLRELDKRLDESLWTRGSATSVAGLKLGTRRDRVIVELSEEATAWPWCEWSFEVPPRTSRRRTKLIWMGFRVLEDWERSPTPRYLLASVLERLSS